LTAPLQKCTPDLMYFRFWRLLRFEKEQSRSLLIQALSIPTRTDCSAQW